MVERIRSPAKSRSSRARAAGWAALSRCCSPVPARAWPWPPAGLDALEDTAAAIRAAGGEALPVAMDLTDAGAIRAALRRRPRRGSARWTSW